jgi:hypothetical protein
LLDAAFDRRWVKIRRPTVVVGGELTMDSLEIRHDPNSNVSEASLQMKSNCGCLLVDDFGRQRIEPQELLNRWIVPLEGRIDFLTLASGKKIQVPFEQLIIFSTNLEPSDLVDDAFLRRIPYKIEIGDPTPAEFHELFQIYCRRFECEYLPKVIDYLLSTHFLGCGRRLRRCHPRDLLNQIRNFCVYNDLQMEIRPEYFDRVVKSYFTAVLNQPGATPAVAPPNPAAAITPKPVPAPQAPPVANTPRAAVARPAAQSAQPASQAAAQQRPPQARPTQPQTPQTQSPQQPVPRQQAPVAASPQPANSRQSANPVAAGQRPNPPAAQAPTPAAAPIAVPPVPLPTPNAPSQ